MIANRMIGVSESATLKLNALVQTLKAQGVDVVNFTAGEPDFTVHTRAKRAAVAAIDQDQSRYTPAAGILKLRELIALKTNRQQTELSSPWKATDVVVTNGGKQALFNALMSLVNPGDEVVIPGPFWLSYPEMVKIVQGKPVVLMADLESGFKITPEQLRTACNDRTKVLVLNSPSNPTGAMYSRDELRALGEVLKDFPKIVVLSDEIYDRIVLSDIPFCSFLGACPQLQDRTVTLNGMSKSYAMTGWRIGWSVAPAAITSAMMTLQGQSTSGINSVAQWASIEALQIPDSDFKDQVEAYKIRGQLLVQELKKIARLRVFEPKGAFYVFADFSKFFRAGEDSFKFCERVLTEARVSLVPGDPFGSPGFARFSFALDTELLKDGVRRLQDYLR